VAARVRLVLREPDPGKAISTFAYRQDWRLEQNIKRTEFTAHEVVYRVVSGDTRIHFTEDHIIRLAYLTVRGSHAEEIANLLRQKLKVFTLEEMLEEAQRAKTRDQWIWAVYQLAAASRGQPDPRIDQALKRALENDDPDVRRAAITAMGYAESRSLESDLARLADKDPEEAVRGDARYMLDGLRKIWEGSKT
jgi:HEAT repeat protein